MISLMRELDLRLSEGMNRRRDILAAGIAGAALLAARPVAALAASGAEPADASARLRRIVQAYGGEFGPARRGA